MFITVCTLPLSTAFPSLLGGCGSAHDDPPTGHHRNTTSTTINKNRISASSTGRLYLAEDAVDYCAALEGVSNEYDIPGRDDITERWSSGKALMRCVSQLTISRFDALFTLHNLRYGVAEAYAFTDIAKDSTTSIIQNNTCGFQVYDIRVDLIGVFDRKIEEMAKATKGMTGKRRMEYLKGPTPALPFHGGLMDVLNSLYDAHTYYQSPLNMFTFVLPVGFQPVCSSNDSPCPDTSTQKVRLREVGLDVEYRKIFTKWPTVHHYNYLSPIATINGQEVLEWMESMVTGGVLKGLHQGVNQRINDWFFINDAPLYIPLAWYHVSSADDITPLQVVYEDGTSDTIEWLGKLIDYSKGMESMGVSDGLSWRVYNSLINRNTQFDYVIDMEKRKFGRYLNTLTDTPNTNLAAADPQLDYAVTKVLENGRRRPDPSAPEEVVNGMKGDDDGEGRRRVTSALVDKKIRRSGSSTPHGSGDRIPHPMMVRGSSGALDTAAAASSSSSRAQLPRWKEAIGGVLKWRVEANAMVVVITTFSISPHTTNSHDILLPQFFQIQEEARRMGIRRILLDLSGNTGGSLNSAFAVLWYLLTPSEVCQPQAKHITNHWRLWLQSFAFHWSKSVDDGARRVWRRLEDASFIQERMDELRSILRYAAAIDKSTIGDDLDGALRNVDGLEAWVLGMQDGKARRWAFLQILQHQLFLTESAREDITRSSTGWYPFGNTDFVDPATGASFDPPLRQYQHPETHHWGGSSNYSQRAPWRFCEDIINRQMPALQRQYAPSGIRPAAAADWSYWREVAVLTDGRCGSACTTVAATLYLSKRATTYTFGGRIDKAMAFGSYAGGNVVSYDHFWPRFSIASHLAHWGTLGGSPWSKRYGKNWVHYATIFPTTATASFTFNMAFHTALGQQSLPVQWYEMPSHYHEEVGIGNFCTVYRARDEVDDSLVALKVFHKDEIRRAKKEKDVLMEKHALSRLHHPNIIKLLYTFTDPHNCYIVTEYCEGGELWNLVAHCGLGEGPSKYYLKQMAEALRYCHQA
ncbi:hypothetical protein FOZ63_010492, partial [Perkinsus olseni]